jgi:hypothetical protein
MATVFATTRCKQYGHPEVTITLEVSEPAVLQPRTAAVQQLLAYFEGGVAGGTKFLPEQVVQFGGVMLRMISRPDGTLGVTERDSREPYAWNERVDRAARNLWRQVEICRSIDAPSERWWFAREDHLAIVCARLFETEGAIFMRRLSPDPVRADDSRWVMFCDEEDHDHDDEGVLELASLLDVEHRLPGLANFFALPAKTDVLVQPGRRRDDGQSLVHGTIFLDGEVEAAVPNPGSYLLLLNEGVDAMLGKISSAGD